MTDSQMDLDEQSISFGEISGIPVRNLWLLMLYASDLFRSLEKAKIAVEENPDDIPDLVAEILAHLVECRLKRNLSYGYRHRETILGRVRGRIDLLFTERHRLLDRGLIACRFEELTIDTPRNRFVRSALEIIASVVRRRELVHRCGLLAATLRRLGVTGECPNPKVISGERFGRQDCQDKQMVSAAQLAFELALPTEASGLKHLASPDRDVIWVRKLYEKGVSGFYGVVLSSNGWQVDAGKTIDWPFGSRSHGIDEIFPSMRTDIILDQACPSRRIVIDTKFNSIVKRGWYRDETLRSGYIYQIYAYLRSQEDCGDPLSDHASGLLLHPSLGEMLDESVVIQGHEIRFATVDLAADASEIRRQLLHVIEARLPRH